MIGLVALLLTPRIPLGSHYHDFADNRAFFGIPNFLDVISNLPFLLVGLWGAVWLFGSSSRPAFQDQRERIPYIIFFMGVALTGIGSFWYHLAPTNSRLPWDLLPMTSSFMSMVVAMYMERIDPTIGLISLGPLLLLGTASVAYWYISESHGHGNYKFYLFVQFFSPLLLASIVGLFPPRYSGMRYLVIAFSLFVAAKLFEMFDLPIYSSSRETISGHSLKHITAAISCYWILRMLQVRRAVASQDRKDQLMPNP
ncbi:MAG: ceramidase domain-containing protein [Edaphobacter sp.]